MVLLLILAVLMGIVISLQFYIKNELKLKMNKGMGLATGTITTFSSFISGFFSTATCATCIGTIFGIIGLGSSFTMLLLEYQWQIVAIGFLFAVISIYYSLRKITVAKTCAVCNVGDKVGK
jgi:hypothetical protein